ncbi:MAG: S8 family serine peptidase, partial [Bacteroidetes bacterium]|nr:S8 family serine peptidase [Fibrella sp.]
GDKFQSLTIGAGQSVLISFQWDDPFFSVSGGAGAQTDMDLLVYVGGVFQRALSSENFNIGGDAVEIIGLTNNGGTAVPIELVLAKFEGPDPTIVKWVNFGSTIPIEYDTRSSTAVGHTNSSRCISVGAAPFFNTPAYNPALTTATIEPFSSAGGTPIYFTTTGTRLGAPVVRQKPEITAVDGTNTTFFGFDTNRDSDTFPNFFGTSAAAPHAAAVAALMKQKVPTITPATILSTLQNTALDMNDPSTAGFDTGFDFGTGFGFIQADRALQAITPTEPTGPATLTITSFNCFSTNGALSSVNFVVGYSNGTFTPALPPLFINGVTINGQLGQQYDFGFDTNQSFLPIADNASRSVYFVWDFRAACAGPVTPPAATPPVAPTLPNQTATQGTFFSYVVPPFTGTMPIAYSASGLPAGLSFDGNSRTISGTPSMTGVSTVVISASNSAGQGSGQFTITVNAPATPPTGPATLTITSFNCFSTNGALSSVNFVVGYSDGTFTPALPPLFIVGVTANGQLGVPYTFGGFDANASTLPIADNASRSVYFVWNFRAACASQQVNARLSAEPVAPLHINVLGNPVSNLIEVEVTGAEGGSLNLTLTDTQGRTVGQQSIEKAATTENVRFNVGDQPAGVLLLKAFTPTQNQTLRLLKAE